jgi:alpha-tubulin suppressor-like RCC1 family protein
MTTIMLLLTGCPFGGNSGNSTVAAAKKDCSPKATPAAVEKEKGKKVKLFDVDTALESVDTAVDASADPECIDTATTDTATTDTATTDTATTDTSSVVVSRNGSESTVVIQNNGETTTINADSSVVDSVISSIISAMDPTPKYAAIALSVDSHSFGSGTLNSESEFTLTVTNSGEGAASSVALSSLTTPYRIISHNCGATLAANSSCAMTLGYKPTANGDHAATLTVSYNDGQEDKTKACSLSGIASPTVDSISPVSSVATQTLTLTGSNFTSSMTVTVGSQACAKTSVTATQFACTIPAGSGSQVVTATDNQKQGQYSSFTYLAPANIALSASSHDFGNVRKTNTSSAFSFTLTNNGGFAASNIVVSTDTPFSKSGSCESLAAGANCTISVTYAPTTVRSDSDTLGVSYNNGTTSASTSASLAGACIPKVVQVDAGNGHSCVLYSEGNIKCVGSIQRLGNGSNDFGNITSWADATEVSGISNATQMSSNESGSCARLSDGTVKCWGQYLPGDATYYRTPQAITGITNAVNVQVGSVHIAIRTADGYIKSFGLNPDGRIGDNSIIQRSPTVSVLSIPDTYQVIDHAAGSANTCAVTSTGGVLCWGDNIRKQVAFTGDVDFRVPTLVTGISDAIQVTSGSQFSCALSSDGVIKCWGYSHDAQVSGTTSNGSEVRQIVITGWQPIADFVAVDSGAAHSCAIKTNKTVYCWGNNQFGQVGPGHNDSQYEYFVTPAVNLTDVNQISTGSYSTMALTSTGNVYVWGINSNGQLGLGDTSIRTSPTNINIQ